ncbi:DNA-directed RNA polymerase subunit beta', partial [Candidatus Uhrbacteria bacterium]|nr:DNA-directed RNA polymerase subunit beta' [Candidatus Uhrbacteria bacterium]
MAQSNDFNAIRISLASPEQVTSWSYGEVTKPETINYRTLRPEKDGLFCERIFGPTKDWECYCGKYKKIRYKGIICDKCGVEVTRAVVRRERMGHIALAAPVSHIWFLRGVPSKIGLVLDMSVQNLEKVIYFANFIITNVDKTAKEQTIAAVRDEYKGKRRQIEADAERKTKELAGTPAADGAETPASKEVADAVRAIEREKKARLAELDEAFEVAEGELNELEPLEILTEHDYQSLSLKYGHVFDAKIGAEAIHYLLTRMDMKVVTDELEKSAIGLDGPRREKVMRRLKLLRSLQKNKIHPAWMMLTMIPIIPPDLRPMVPLDGGRYATSDLNDLYRRVINRNNRLKQLLELNAPEVIVRNEKRMLQEAVDALIDNAARHGKTVMASTGQKRMLKSLADMLKGKQGRFRQNLLGKRVDYSGRSVIVVGPHLKLHQCGLPKKMAMELFKPFVMSQLIKRGYVHNVRSASRFIESGRSEIWDILEEITSDRHVLLNRAPTLHRLGIQAFQPILIEGKAIQLHPLVCAAFNADFDGDQMAVHVPLTDEARAEARDLMLSTKNLLKPATGDPIMTPNQDIVWGIYYLTSETADTGRLPLYANPAEALLAYRSGFVTMHDRIRVRMAPWHQPIEGMEKGMLDTSAGRIIFNQVLPGKIPFQNQIMDKKKMGKIIRMALDEYGTEKTAELLDDMKELAFKYLTRSGLSWGMGDVPALEAKKPLIAEADRAVDEVREQFENGLLTESERREKVIRIWNDVKDKVVELSKKSLDPRGSAFAMIDSGARGSWGQLTQIVGMKGLVTNPTGDIIELPVKGSFKEGFTVLEYFISTHGARKGLSDTALRTANAGYLTRRLVDVSQELVTRSEDCGDAEGFLITRVESEAMGEPMLDRIAGRILAEGIKDPETKKVIVKKGTLVTEAIIRSLKSVSLTEVRIRSLLTCRARKGVCELCYGTDLGYNKPVARGVPVGVIAAQSIGEPGTQLTMRTFHSG